MIKPRQQFKIESIEELKEAYKNLPFLYPLEKEINDFKFKGMKYLSLDSRKYVLWYYDKDLEVVQNPFKKYGQPEHIGIDKAMDHLSKEAKKLGFEVEVVFKNIEK